MTSSTWHCSLEAGLPLFFHAVGRVMVGRPVRRMVVGVRHVSVFNATEKAQKC